MLTFSAEQLLRLDHADIGVDRVGEAGLLLRDQVGALRHDLVLGAVDVRLDLAAVVDRLRDRRLCGGDDPVGLRVEEAAATVFVNARVMPSP